MSSNIDTNSTRISAWPTGQHEEVRARIAKHREADEIIQGFGWIGGEGCAIGCSLDNYDHVEYARVLGVPLAIACLIDCIHEGLPRELALDWPGRVANALQPGADTTYAWSRFAIRILRERFHIGHDRGEDMVVGLYERRIAGDEASPEEWRNSARRVGGLARSAVEAARLTTAMRAMVWAAELTTTVRAMVWAANERVIRYPRQSDILIDVLAMEGV